MSTSHSPLPTTIAASTKQPTPSLHSVSTTDDTFQQELQHLMGQLATLHQDNIDAIALAKTVSAVPPRRTSVNVHKNCASKLALNSNTVQPTSAVPPLHRTAVASLQSLLATNSLQHGHKATALLRLQLHHMATQRHTLMDQLQHSRSEVQQLQHLLAAPPTSTATQSTTHQASATAAIDPNKYEALQIKLKSLNIGFQGLNDACAAADQHSMKYALSLFHALARTNNKFAVNRAWRTWTTACHALSHTQRETRAVQRQHDQQQQQQQQHEQQQQHNQRLQQAMDAKDTTIKHLERQLKRSTEKNMAMKRQHDQHQYQHEQHQKHRQRLQHDLVTKQAKIEHLDRTVEQNQRALDNAFDSIVVEEHADRYAMFLFFVCVSNSFHAYPSLLLTDIFRILSTCDRSVLVELVETASVATASRMQQVQASLETMASRCERAQHRIDRVGAFCSLLPLCFTRYCCIRVWACNV